MLSSQIIINRTAAMQTIINNYIRSGILYKAESDCINNIMTDLKALCDLELMITLIESHTMMEDSMIARAN
jgi:archaellum biogenesis ATPase FlaH